MQNSHFTNVRGIRTVSGAHMYEVTDSDRVAYIDVYDYAINQKAAVASLVPQGLFVSGAKRRQLLARIAEIDEFEYAPVFDRVGWNGDHFVYLDGHVFSPSAAPPADIIFQTKPDRCHRTGSLDGWLSEVAGKLSGQRLPEFALMVPFAAPLRRHTSRAENFGWEFVGLPAAGKSVLLQVMASICGGSLNGEEGSYLQSFAATSAGIEWEMQNHSDLPMIIDEGNLYELTQSRAGRGRSFTQLTMALGKGQEKRRFRSDARSFKFVFAIASNETLADIVTGTSAAAVVQAVSDRLMTINVGESVFEAPPTRYQEVGDFIADLVAASSRNHGVAMPHYLAGLVALYADDRLTFRARLDHRIAEFRQHTGIEANAGSARRVADAFGLVYAAGRLAIHLGALPKSFNPLASTLACYRRHRTAFQAEQSPAAKLTALRDDPDVIDLDRGLPRLSDRRLAKTEAFKRTVRPGVTEILLPPSSIRRLIPDWNRVRRDDFEVARMIVREDGRHTVKRRVREGNRPDRVICIVAPD